MSDNETLLICTFILFTNLVTVKKTLYCRSYHVLHIWFYYFVLNLVAKNKSYWNDFLKIIFLNINLIIQYSYINARLYCMYNMLIKITNFVLKIILWNWISSTNPKTALQKYLPFFLLILRFFIHIKTGSRGLRWFDRA